jgi:ATP-binding cassette, subfamily B, bacterial HlyB/CyaB
MSEHDQEEQAEAASSGLASLILMLRYLGLPADPAQIRHRFGASLGAAEILRCAKEFHLKARLVITAWKRLARMPLPAIAERKDGSFFILGKVAAEGALVQDPAIGRPQALSEADFRAQWSGRLLLITRRAALGELQRRFDVGWFLQAMHKYRRLFGEVLAASFFLQIFALVMPLFFQVITDKVLVHRGLTTLNVLIIGLATVSLFETVLGTLRTYVFAHTTNRIDVELGARLFRHLMALPIAYFEARRTGDSVARVRELENIRTFLTSSALTLCIDLLFTVVFLAVMFWYSPLLTWIVIGSFPFYVGLSASLPGREHHRRRDAEGDGGRAADAAALGRAARRLCERELPRHLARQLGKPVGAVHQQDRHRADALFRRPARDR